MMTKDELQQIIVVCLNDLTSQHISESEQTLIMGFMDNLRQKASAVDQSDQFVEILKEKLKKMQS